MYDPIIQGLSGLAEVQNGDYMRSIVVDKTAAMTGANAILAALVARAGGAGGQHIDVNLLDSMLAWLFVDAYWNETIPDAEPAPTYSEWYEPWPTSDGLVTANWTNFEQYQGACRAVGRPDLADDPRFTTREARVRNAHAQRAEFAAALGELTTEQALAALRAADVPCGPVLDRREVLDDPQVRHNGSVIESEHPTAGRIRTARPPARFSKTPSAIERHAPGKAEHTDEILREIGLDDGEIDRLREAGVVA